jgi:hypothetical protein
MESRFRHDFSGVRIHADREARESAAARRAQAYTVGSDIAFASGTYDPDSDAGKRLVAHELVHVVQQRGANGSHASVDAEREAALMGDAAAEGRHVAPIASTPVRVAAQPAPGAPASEPEVDAVEADGQSYVLYPKEVRTKGSSSWLANNPGNMDYTPELVEWGAYEGKKLKWGAHRFAIFPDQDTGLSAVERFLRKHQGLRDIKLMMSMFAPAGDVANDPDAYAKRVAKALGVPVSSLVKDMSDEQLSRFADEIMSVEGWKEGTTYRRGDAALPEQARH